MKINCFGADAALKTALAELTKTLSFELVSDSSNEGYKLVAVKCDANAVKVENGELRVFYATYNYIFRAVRLFLQNGGECDISEKMPFDSTGVMVDCSRNAVLKPDSVKRLVRLLAVMGYSTLQLYTEDTYEVEGEPYFGYLRGRFTGEELRELDSYCALFGIELIPCIQTLAHLNAAMRWEDIGKLRDIDFILDTSNPGTYELIDKMFASLAKNFTTRRINVGMDEAHNLGRGARLDNVGLESRSDIMLAHLQKVRDIAAKYGFKCMIWSDMFVNMVGGRVVGAKVSDEVKARIPKDVSLIYWDYYSLDSKHYDSNMNLHAQFGNEIWFAGGSWTWVGFAPHNEFSIASTDLAVKCAVKHGIKNMFLTMWGDNGGECSPFMVLPALVNAAEKIYGYRSITHVKRSFACITGMKYDTFMALDLPDQPGNTSGSEMVNPSKYLLYSDVFGDLFAADSNPADKEILLEHAKRIKRGESNPEYGYLFKPLRILCEIMYLKYDLGAVTVEAYKSGDRESLKTLIKARYKPLITKIKQFSQAHCDRWERDDKPDGFDIQDYRLGGLIKRLEHETTMLEEFVSGKRERIELLERELLSIRSNPELRKSVVCFNCYEQSCSTNVF